MDPVDLRPWSTTAGTTGRQGAGAARPGRSPSWSQSWSRGGADHRHPVCPGQNAGAPIVPSAGQASTTSGWLHHAGAGRLPCPGVRAPFTWPMRKSPSTVDPGRGNFPYSKRNLSQWMMRTSPSTQTVLGCRPGPSEDWPGPVKKLMQRNWIGVPSSGAGRCPSMSLSPTSRRMDTRGPWCATKTPPDGAKP